jgi:hypothetical protein
MSPICAYVQWKIAHLTVVGSGPKVGSWPALHLSRCAECRRVAAEYEATRMLVTFLQRLPRYEGPR